MRYDAILCYESVRTRRYKDGSYHGDSTDELSKAEGESPPPPVHGDQTEHPRWDSHQSRHREVKIVVATRER